MKPPDNDAIKGYIEATPLGDIQRILGSKAIDWSDDTCLDTKAYIMACLSEIAYLCVPGYALKNRDRYLIVPSRALAALNGDDASFGLAEIGCYLLGIGVRLWARPGLEATGVVNAGIAHLGNYVFVVFYLPDFTVIVVRGTAPVLNDVLIDLNEAMEKVNGHGYHAGFYGESKKALPDLMASVTSNNQPLYFTGHSLGGAVAGILPQIWTGTQKVMTPYTFASPRFGDAWAAHPTLHPVYAYVRARDPIPHIPLESSGFQSAGFPLRMIPPTDEWLSGIDLVRLRPKAHSIEGYRTLLGDEIHSPHFAPLVYFDELKARLTKDDLEGLRNEIRWRP
jgi:hypothetical protein